MTVIATGSVDINEATKIAQDASTSASDLADKIKNLKTSLDGTIIESTSTPFDDGKEHNDGDMWLVMSGNIATAMYIYSNGAWTAKKWDVTSLNVKQLSALTADLGTVNAGTINGVVILSSSFIGGSWSNDSNSASIALSSSGIDLVSGSNKVSISPYLGFVDIPGTLDLGSLIVTGSASVSGTTTISGVYSDWITSSGKVKGNGLSISGHTLACDDGGDLYLENYGGGGSLADVHGGTFYAHGTALKSALSAKRDITDYDPDEALAAIMNTDIKKWKYKDSDNSTDSQHVGPIIDDVNAIGNKAYSIDNEMVTTDENGDYFLNESNTISILLAALKKSNQRIDELSYRIAKLERTDSK